MSRAAAEAAHAPGGHWPTRLGLALLRALGRAPAPLRRAAGEALGWAAWLLLAERRRVAEINLALCFPELDAAKRRRMARRCLIGMGHTLVECALAWWGSEAQLAALPHTIEGLEHLERARAGGRPVLLLSAHMAASEIGGRLLARHVPFQILYKPAKNPVFEDAMRRAREAAYLAVVPRKQTRRLLRNLKAGWVTWYAPDQNFGREDTVFTPFFGVPAATLTATSRLARLADATVVPYFPYREGRGWRLVILPPLADFPGPSLEADCARINRVIEEAVRRAPEQYLWVHKRFRVRPPGEPPIYP
ncbi:MAG: lipid A biosynthesis lauroyltransferase [Gammaproteobacteria bacterium]|nr:MAG: lipid A biosynthesis lauroyltransferase [Gammaproteobacteria bacterium]